MRLSSLFQSKPYDLRINRNGLKFTTDRGLIYEIYFAGADKYFQGTSFSHQIFQFGFLPVSQSNLPGIEALPQHRSDPRIMATVIDQIENWLYQYPVTILAYTCSVTDKKHRARQKMFSGVYDCYSNTISNEYVLLPFDSGEDILGALLYKRGNPYEKDIKAFMGSDITERFYNKEW